MPALPNKDSEMGSEMNLSKHWLGVFSIAFEIYSKSVPNCATDSINFLTSSSVQFPSETSFNGIPKTYSRELLVKSSGFNASGYFFLSKQWLHRTKLEQMFLST